MGEGKGVSIHGFPENPRTITGFSEDVFLIPEFLDDLSLRIHGFPIFLPILGFPEEKMTNLGFPDFPSPQ